MVESDKSEGSTAAKDSLPHPWWWPTVVAVWVAVWGVATAAAIRYVDKHEAETVAFVQSVIDGADKKAVMLTALGIALGAAGCLYLMREWIKRVRPGGRGERI